jgi:hypothetical protein
MNRKKQEKLNLRGTQFNQKRSCVIPSNGIVVDQATWALNSCSDSDELSAQHVLPHQIPKRPYLQEEDMPVAFCRSCHVSLQKLELQR